MFNQVEVFTDFDYFPLDFKRFVLSPQEELRTKFGHYEYLLITKRSFPGSFTPISMGDRALSFVNSL